MTEDPTPAEDATLNEDPALVVHRLATELDNAADAMLTSRHGISQARYRVLHALRGEDALTQHAVAVRLGVGDAVVSRMLPALVDQGWCAVQDDPAHGRRRLVSLTSAGADLEAECTAFLSGAFAGAAQDAGVAVTRLLADIEAVTQQVRRSMAAR